MRRRTRHALPATIASLPSMAFTRTTNISNSTACREQTGRIVGMPCKTHHSLNPGHALIGLTALHRQRQEAQSSIELVLVPHIAQRSAAFLQNAPQLSSGDPNLIPLVQPRPDRAGDRCETSSVSPGRAQRASISTTSQPESPKFLFTFVTDCDTSMRNCYHRSIIGHFPDN